METFTGAAADAGARGRGEEVAQNGRAGSSLGFELSEEAFLQDKAEIEARRLAGARDWAQTMKSAAAIREHLTMQEVDRCAAGEVVQLGFDGSGAATGPNRSFSSLAGKMEQNSERLAEHEIRQQGQQEAQRRRTERIAAAHAASDARASQRHQARLEAQRTRVFNATQRRNEQQKCLREFHREKDRVWQAYQEKHQQQRNSVSKSSSLPLLGDTAADFDIHREVEASHQMYAAELDNWRKFVMDNDRRTDRRWKAILQGTSRQELLGETPGDRMIRGMKAVKNASALLKHRGAEIFVSKEDQVFLLSLVAGDDKPKATWQKRRQQCMEYAEECLDKNAANRDLQEQHLAEARARITQQNANRSGAASEQARVWQRKYDAACEKRSARELLTDDALVAKMAAHSARMDARHAERSAASDTHLRELQADIGKKKAAQQAHVDAKVEAARALREKDRQAAAERVVLLNDAHKKHVDNDTFYERLKIAQERKKKDVQESLKLEGEICAKDARSKQTLKMHRLSAFEKERARRQAGPSPTLEDAGAAIALQPIPVPMTSIRDAPGQQGSNARKKEQDMDLKQEAYSEHLQAFLEELGARSAEWLDEHRRTSKKIAV